MCVLVAQLCPTPCNPVDCSPPPPLYMEFSRQEHWSGLSFPSSGDLLEPGIKPGSPAFQADSLPSKPPGSRTQNTSEVCLWTKINFKWIIDRTLKCCHAVVYNSLWSVACQALLSLEFSRQEYWSGLPFPSPGDLPNPGIEPGSPASQADSLLSELPGKPPKPLFLWILHLFR